MLSPLVETFLSIVKAKSVSRAADSLHLSQPSVTRRLQLLEEGLGYSLIERGKGIKTFQLTPRGARFLAIAEQMENLAAEARQAVPEPNGQALTIGGYSSADMTFLPRLVFRLLSATPDMRLKFLSVHSREMYAAVEQREADVAFSLVEQAHHTVSARACFAVPMVGIRAADKEGKPVEDVDSLDSETLVSVSWGSRYQIWHDHWFGSRKPPRICADSAILTISLLELPNTWAIVPRDIAAPLAASGRFATFKLNPEPPARVFFKLTHKYPTPQVRAALGLFDNALGGMLQENLENGYTEL